jgi:hypothetical protein
MYCLDKERCAKENPEKFIACVDDDLCYCADCFVHADNTTGKAPVKSGELLAACIDFYKYEKECEILKNDKSGKTTFGEFMDFRMRQGTFIAKILEETERFLSS